MKRTPVANSSNIASAGCDAETQTMEVEFTSGNVYEYFDVPQTVYEELMRAESVGKFMNAQVKGVYRFARL